MKNCSTNTAFPYAAQISDPSSGSGLLFIVSSSHATQATRAATLANLMNLTTVAGLVTLGLSTISSCSNYSIQIIMTLEGACYPNRNWFHSYPLDAAICHNEVPSYRKSSGVMTASNGSIWKCHGLLEVTRRRDNRHMVPSLAT